MFDDVTEVIEDEVSIEAGVVERVGEIGASVRGMTVREAAQRKRVTIAEKSA